MSEREVRAAPQAGGRVTVTRTDAADVGIRQVLARIDDGATTSLMFGDSMTRELAPGDYKLRLNNTLVWKTVPFTIAAGGHVRIVVINRSGLFSFGVLAMIGAAPLFLSVRVEEA